MKDNDITSRYHQELSTPGRQFTWTLCSLQAAQWFVRSQHGAISLLGSRSPKGLPKGLALFIFLYLPDFSQVLSIEGGGEYSLPLRERAWHLWINFRFFCHFKAISSVHSRQMRKELCSLGLGFKADPFKSENAWLGEGQHITLGGYPPFREHPDGSNLILIALTEHRECHVPTFTKKVKCITSYSWLNSPLVYLFHG